MKLYIYEYILVIDRLERIYQKQHLQLVEGNLEYKKIFNRG